MGARFTGELDIDNMLHAVDSDLGHVLDPVRSRIVVIFSSISMGMKAVAEIFNGYGDGLLLTD